MAHGVAIEVRPRPPVALKRNPELLEQYILGDGAFQLAQKSGSGEVQSTVVSGFRIPVPALFDAQLNIRTARDLLGRETD